VGASAAGLLAALFAARAGQPPLVLETRPRPGAKIRVSGGGRCNILPSRAGPEDFHTSGSSRTLRNILLSWPLAEVRSFFEEDVGIPLVTEASGKVFPTSGNARDVVDGLLRICAEAGVRMETGVRVEDVGIDPEGFSLECADGQARRCRKLLLATGGLSLPKSGSDGGGLRLAHRLGHSIAPTFPVLVPLLSPDGPLSDLPGLSLPVRLRALRQGNPVAEAEGGFLFTHRGFSGPAVLDISREFAQPDADGTTLEAAWGGTGTPWAELLRQRGPATLGGVLREHLPRRLADTLLEEATLPPHQRLAELPRAQRVQLEDLLVRYPLATEGNEGYRTAEATGGGIHLSDLETKTLESRIRPGLFFEGEMIDVDGRLGGYNFLWAWVSGRRAGEAAARHVA
jgi:predicted Rossmann fold flavoprotein